MSRPFYFLANINMSHDIPVKNKALYRSAKKMLDDLQERHYMWEKWIGTLQFQVQDHETRQHFYDAIDSMRKFVDNIS